jgi:bla regulator protein blaR1
VYSRPVGRRLGYRLVFIVSAVIVALAGLLSFPGISAQSRTADWEKVAGSKMAFDVASVKRHPYDPASPGYMTHTNIPLNSSDSYMPTGGLLSAENLTVLTYISFAYKLTADETNSMVVPKWGVTEHFDIGARGPVSDQMRLMMQSLLADRFKLAVHWENRETSVFSVVLLKPGKPGPNLVPYTGEPCPDGAKPTQSNAKFPWGVCGQSGMKFLADGTYEVIGRNVPIQQLVALLRRWPGRAIDRRRNGSIRRIRLPIDVGA